MWKSNKQKNKSKGKNGKLRASGGRMVFGFGTGAILIAVGSVGVPK